MNQNKWEEAPIRYGIYIGKTGKLAVAEPSKGRAWTIDKGENKTVEILPGIKLTSGVVAEGTGTFFFNNLLRGYELLERTHSWHQYTRRMPYKTNVKLFSFYEFITQKRIREITKLNIPINDIDKSCLVSKTK